MNEFLITEMRTTMDRDPYLHAPSIADPYNPIMTSHTVYQAFELTLRPLGDAGEVGRKLNNILRAGRKVTLNDTEYDTYMEPFKAEFLDFMMEKHPEKIIADPEAWERLLGRR